ncbi:hypothetical protein BSKO_09476 [Bryopsis sp. KO-2023]|nr:hypothetical protein BSKO_09476 [Bryopsis sp. KO-2023]
MKKARSEVATSQNPESVVAAVASLFVDPLFSDTTISAEDGKEWRCHKNILAASSSVFLTLYNSGEVDSLQVSSFSPPIFQRKRLTLSSDGSSAGLKESKSSVVLISDTTSAAIDCLLGYVYTGRLACGIESVVDVLELSHRFQVDSLHSAVERVLENSISDDTCCELINSCSRWSKQFETCRNIWTRCLEHLAAFFHRIWKLDSFLALEYHSFTNLLETFGKSVVCDIEDMNQAISRWASHDKETRVVHLAELNRLAVSERKDIPKDVKSYSVLKEGSISTHPRCGDLVCHFDEMSPDVSSFLVPRDGFYYILAAGGKAGDCTNTIGGSGAFIGGLLWLNGGEAIRASIGHRSKDNYEGSPLVVAGGGGGGQGGDNVYSVDGKDAELFVSGSRGAGSNQAPGGTSGMNAKVVMAFLKPFMGALITIRMEKTPPWRPPFDHSEVGGLVGEGLGEVGLGTAAAGEGWVGVEVEALCVLKQSRR